MIINLSEEMIEKIIAVSEARCRELEMVVNMSTQADLKTKLEDAKEVRELFIELMKETDKRQ